VPNKKREKGENICIDPYICNNDNLNQSTEIIDKQTVEKEIIITTTIEGPELMLTKTSNELN
jgi:hypothetical protein